MYQSDANVSMTDAAAAAAHALNNLLATLYGAASYLETTDSTAVVRASAAIGKACATGRALSAALYLLSLTDGVADTFAASTRADIVLDETERERIVDALREVASVEFVDPAITSPSTVRLGLDILEALLICAAFSMRREAGPKAVIWCSMRIEEGQAPDASTLTFVLDAPELAGRPIAALAPARRSHPCAIAVAHAAPRIPAECATWDQDSMGTMRLRLRLGP